jgi:hypothetical protein
MFTPEQRTQLRATLLESAASDPRITAAAITGSAATGAEDQWSDIDLAFATTADPAVIPDWTVKMYADHGALHHWDMPVGPWLYRVFFLKSTLQVDLAFAPQDEFRALAPSFQLVKGAANEPKHHPAPPPEYLIGLAWLHAIHARSSIARHKLWQAEYMVSGVRDNALALACLRHGAETIHARGIHHLPPDLAKTFEPALVTALNESELTRAFRAVVALLQTEIQQANPELAATLSPALADLCDHIS